MSPKFDKIPQVPQTRAGSELGASRSLVPGDAEDLCLFPREPGVPTLCEAETVRRLEVLCLGTDPLCPRHLLVVMEAGTICSGVLTFAFSAEEELME